MKSIFIIIAVLFVGQIHAAGPTPAPLTPSTNVNQYSTPNGNQNLTPQQRAAIQQNNNSRIREAQAQAARENARIEKQITSLRNKSAQLAKESESINQQLANSGGLIEKYVLKEVGDVAPPTNPEEGRSAGMLFRSVYFDDYPSKEGKLSPAQFVERLGMIVDVNDILISAYNNLAKSGGEQQFFRAVSAQLKPMKVFGTGSQKAGSSIAAVAALAKLRKYKFGVAKEAAKESNDKEDE